MKLVFDSLDEIHSFLKQINVAAVPAVDAGGGVTANANSAGAPSTAPAAAPEQGQPRRGRPRKAEAAAPSSAGTSTAEPPAAPPASAPEQQPAAPVTSAAQPATPSAAPAAADPSKPATEADVRAVLMKVNEKYGNGGLAKVSDIVTRVGGVPSIKMLKPEQYAAVIAEAEKELAK
jgi:hypothetical protein